MIPKKLLNILSFLNSEEWIKCLLQLSNVYIVGGSVRDIFLNKDIKDIDLIVEGLSFKEICNKLMLFGKVDIVGESFSVIKFKPKGFVGESFDIAIPRTDRKIGTGHKGFEIITKDIDVYSDLKRRDFTINSIAINVKTSDLIDPFNGINDIKNKILRATDKNAFVEDPLRIMRGIGFVSRFDFKIESETLELMKQNSHLIKEISGERIFEELLKIINKRGNTKIALNLLNETGVGESLFNKKMNFNIEENLNNLDCLSFFYILSKLGGTNPSIFVKNKLKGDSTLEKKLKVLHNVLSYTPTNEEKTKLMLFKAIERAPNIINASILNDNKIYKDIILQMKSNEIPTNVKDIKINGNDIISLLGLTEGQEIGIIKKKIIKDALMNRFNWKNKNDSIKHLKSIYENCRVFST